MTPTEREYIWVGVHGSVAVFALLWAVVVACAGSPGFTVLFLVCAAWNGLAAHLTLRRVRRLVRGDRWMRFRVEVSFTWDRDQWWFQWFRHRDRHGRSWILDLWPLRFAARTWEER